VQVDKWKQFRLLLHQYLNKWLFAEYITSNSMESFPLINTARYENTDYYLIKNITDKQWQLIIQILFEIM